jgi:hypothetical protein
LNKNPQPNGHDSKRCGRFKCLNWEIELEGGIGSLGETVKHAAIVSLAFDEKGRTREVVFEGRGKIGQGIDLLLHDLSIQLSRILQERDPTTGASMWE